MKIAFCDVRGLLNDLNDKLSGENGERWRDKLANMLRESSFLTWRKLQIGFLGSARALLSALQNDGFRVGEYANQILNKVKIGKKITELELVMVTQADLGFAEGTTFEKMIARAKEYGLEECPAEVGPYLRLAYKDQLHGEWLRVAIEPVAVSDGGLSVFRVGHDGDGLWLFAGWFSPQHIWNPDFRWVFVRSRK